MKRKQIDPCHFARIASLLILDEEETDDLEELELDEGGLTRLRASADSLVEMTRKHLEEAEAFSGFAKRLRPCIIEPKPEWPECYLHVEDCRSGQTWVVPIKGNMLLALEPRVKAWIKQEFGGECELSGYIQPRLQGDYYAAIYTDHRPPTSAVCWQSGGFYVQ